jgi:hypothetical protein
MKYPKHFSPLAVIVAGTLTLGMVFTAGAQEAKYGGTLVAAFSADPGVNTIPSVCVPATMTARGEKCFGYFIVFSSNSVTNFTTS